MSKLRWEKNDGGRVWTLMRDQRYSDTLRIGQPVGYLSKSGPGFWAVYQYDDDADRRQYGLVATVDDLDEAKALLQTLAGVNHV